MLLNHIVNSELILILHFPETHFLQPPANFSSVNDPQWVMYLWVSGFAFPQLLKKGVFARTKLLNLTFITLNQEAQRKQLLSGCTNRIRIKSELVGGQFPHFRF